MPFLIETYYSVILIWFSHTCTPERGTYQRVPQTRPQARWLEHMGAPYATRFEAMTLHPEFNDN